MPETADAVIVGGGIVGASLADALSADGLKVVVVEREILAAGATSAGMGHIVVMDDNPAEFALTRYSCQLWRDLVPELPAEVEYDPAGTIWVAVDEEEMAGVHAKFASYTGSGVAAEVMDAKSLEEAEPNLRKGFAGGLRVPGDSIVYAPCAAQWFMNRAMSNGAKLLIGNAVAKMDGKQVVLANGTTLVAGMTICAAGAWSSSLFPQLDVRPRKGHLAITDRYPGFVRHQLVELGYLKSAHGHSEESVAFNVQPRKTGQFLIGSSRQYGKTHKEIDQPLLRKMLLRALEYVPSLADLSVVRTWAGFRPSTPDNMPAVGLCPGETTLYVNTGHEGLGITTCLGTARLLADLIAGRTPAIDSKPFSPERLWKQ